MDNDTSEIVDILNHMVATMPTKDDIAELRAEMNDRFDAVHSEMKDIRSEIKDIRARLDAIEVELKNQSGFAKEIDHLMERVRAIEIHLGIQKKIAA